MLHSNHFIIYSEISGRVFASICKTCLLIKIIDLDKAFDLFQTVNFSFRVIVILPCKQLYFWSEANDIHKKT